LAAKRRKRRINKRLFALQYAKIAPFREDFTIPIPNREMARMELARSETISNP